MPINTYIELANITVTSAQSSVTFSSISSSYTDLVLVTSAINPNSANEVYAQFNSDTGTNYSHTQVLGNGTTSTSSRTSNNTYARFAFCNNDYNSCSFLQIMNYSNTTTFKTYLSKISLPDYQTLSAIGLWRSTSPITSIRLTMESAVNISAGSNFTLYGIHGVI